MNQSTSISEQTHYHLHFILLTHHYEDFVTSEIIKMHVSIYEYRYIRFLSFFTRVQQVRQEQFHRQYKNKSLLFVMMRAMMNCYHVIVILNDVIYYRRDLKKRNIRLLHFIDFNLTMIDNDLSCCN